MLLIALLPAVAAHAQSTYLPQGSKFEHFLDRMEILQQTNPELNMTTDKPIGRKLAVRMSEMADSLDKFYPYDELYHLSPVDRATLASLLMNNPEWVSGKKDSFWSKRPWFNTFYKNKAIFYLVEDKDFFLALDPVIQQTQSIESGNGSGTVHVGGTAFLGVESTANSYSSGAEISAVVPGSAAEAAGLTPGDLILSVGGHTISSPDDLSNVVLTQKPGASISAVYLDQAGATRTTSLTLASGPPR